MISFIRRPPIQRSVYRVENAQIIGNTDAAKLVVIRRCEEE